MPEFLVIMHKDPTAGQIKNLKERVRTLKGQVTHAINSAELREGKVVRRYPSRIMIGRHSEGIPKSLREQDGVSRVLQSYEEDRKELEKLTVDLELSNEDFRAVRAWNRSQSPAYREKKASRPKTSRIPKDDWTTAHLAGGASSLTGLVAVGIVIVGGPRNTEAEITPQEETIILREVREGTNYLKNAAPASADLNFAIEMQPTTLFLNPKTVSRESDWISSAIADRGSHVTDLQATNGSNSAYIVFFTKYQANGFAYTPDLGGNYSVIRYPQPGANSKYNEYAGHCPFNLDLLFAHETGHIYGTDDASHATHNCLMSDGTLHICSITEKAFHWTP